MIVVDASVLVNALTDDGPIGDLSWSVLGEDPHWAAPGHLTTEVFSAIRGQVLRGEVGEPRGRAALVTLAAVQVELIDTTPLLERMWQLRANVSGYDAVYVAAAELHGCALVTADARLARVPALQCPVVVALSL